MSLGGPARAATPTERRFLRAVIDERRRILAFARGVLGLVNLLVAAAATAMLWLDPQLLPLLLLGALAAALGWLRRQLRPGAEASARVEAEDAVCVIRGTYRRRLEGTRTARLVRSIGSWTVNHPPMWDDELSDGLEVQAEAFLFDPRGTDCVLVSIERCSVERDAREGLLDLRPSWLFVGLILTAVGAPLWALTAGDEAGRFAAGVVLVPGLVVTLRWLPASLRNLPIRRRLAALHRRRGS